MALTDVCDTVEFTDAKGSVRNLKPHEYEKLPLQDRVSALLAKRLKFYMRGKEVPAREVMAATNR